MAERVQGAEAAGQVATGRPVLVAGLSAGVLKPLAVDGDGNLVVAVEIPPVTVEITEPLEVIDLPHNEVHEGDYYTFNVTSAVATGATFDVLLVTPDTTKYCHMLLEAATVLGGTVDVYEAAVATPGTAVPAYNSNRNSLNTAGLSVTHTPTGITAGTTIIYRMLLTIGSGGSRTGSGTRSVSEIILKRNTTYLVRFTGVSSNGNSYLVRGFWYEHTV